MNILHNKIIKTILIILVLSFFDSFYLYSQNEITFKLDNHLLPLKIYFHDSISGHYDTLDIINRNPFNKLHYIKKGINSYGNKIYQLAKTEVEILLKNNKVIDSLNQLRISDLSYEPFSGSSYFSIYRQSKKYVSIGYTFYVRNSKENQIFITSIISIYDCNGKMIYHHKNINAGIDQLAVTENGKYIAFDYGIDDEEGNIISGGLQIYNTLTNHLILETKEANFGPGIRNNVIFFWNKLYDEESKQKVYVFDAKSMILYSNKYSKSDIEDLKEITDQGFIFNINGIQIIKTYQKTFNKEPLKK